MSLEQLLAMTGQMVPDNYMGGVGGDGDDVMGGDEGGEEDEDEEDEDDMPRHRGKVCVAGGGGGKGSWARGSCRREGTGMHAFEGRVHGLACPC